MKIHVDCRRVHGEDVPLGFRLGERFLRVLRVLSAGDLDGARTYTVKTRDGREFTLSRDKSSGDWELVRAAH
ncbi:MAG: hypothetical protein ACM30H_05775 [Clostridia bacterium]